MEELYRFRAQIECDPPTSDLYTFHGRIEVLPAGPGPGPLHPGREGPGTTEGEEGASEPTREEEQLASEALDTENLLLRGATLKNTEFVYGEIAVVMGVLNIRDSEIYYKQEKTAIRGKDVYFSPPNRIFCLIFFSHAWLHQARLLQTELQDICTGKQTSACFFY